MGPAQGLGRPARQAARPRYAAGPVAGPARHRASATARRRRGTRPSPGGWPACTAGPSRPSGAGRRRVPGCRGSPARTGPGSCGSWPCPSLVLRVVVLALLPVARLAAQFEALQGLRVGDAGQPDLGCRRCPSRSGRRCRPSGCAAGPRRERRGRSGCPGRRSRPARRQRDGADLGHLVQGQSSGGSRRPPGDAWPIRAAV